MRRQRQMGGEYGALSGHALYGKTAAMAVENVLDQRQPEPGASLCSAFHYIDAIEPFGEARQVIWRDPRTVIAHRHARLAQAGTDLPNRQADVDALAGRRIFQRVLDQVLEHA